LRPPVWGDGSDNAARRPLLPPRLTRGAAWIGLTRLPRLQRQLAWIALRLDASALGARLIQSLLTLSPVKLKEAAGGSSGWRGDLGAFTTAGPGWRGLNGRRKAAAKPGRTFRRW